MIIIACTFTYFIIYRSLIGSLMDYSAFAWPRLHESLKKSLQAVQNSAVRIVYHLSIIEHTPTKDLCALAGLPLLEERMVAINERYFLNAIAMRNEFIVDLFGEYWEAFAGEESKVTTLLKCRAPLFLPE